MRKVPTPDSSPCTTIRSLQNSHMVMILLALPTLSPEIDLPPSHSTRSYRTISFPCGLQCLLISDPSSHLFSAALTVEGGHFLDPEQIPGLAHLCEHLVVGGKSTSLYLDINRAGGTSNAYTSSTQTCFAFEVSTYAKHTEGSTEKLAIDVALPKFLKYLAISKFHLDVIATETRAVHDEHMGNTMNCDKVLWHGLRILASESHPFHRFATGSMASLTKPSSRSLQAHIKEYYSKSYQTQNSALVLKGPQSIHQLKKLAIVHFGSLSNGKSSSSRFSLPKRNSISSVLSEEKSTHSCATQEHQMRGPDAFQDVDPNVLYIKADFDPRLRLVFPMSFGAYVVSKQVQRQLCNLFGSESPGSWCHFLKSRSQYLQEVFVSLEEVSPTQYILICDLSMTNKGMRNLQEVISLFFFFVNERILNMPQDTLMDMLDNFGSMEEKLFMREQPLHSSMDEVLEYASRLNGVKSGTYKDFVRGYQPWVPGIAGCKAVVSAIRNAILTTKVKIQILGRSFKYQSQLSLGSSAVTKEVDEHFGFQYVKFNFLIAQDLKLPRSFLDFVRFDPAPPSGSLNSANGDYLLGLIKHRDLSIDCKLPILKINEDDVELWAHAIPDASEFHASVSLCFPNAPATVQNLVGIELITAMVGEALKYKLYHLELLGANWALYPNINGEPSILISYRGEKGIFERALEEMFLHLRTTLQDPKAYLYEDLKRARVFLRRLFVTHQKAKGIEKMEVMIHLLLEGGIDSIEERIDALEMTDIDLLKDLSYELNSGPILTSVLVSGNLKGVDFRILKEQCRIRKNPELFVLLQNYIRPSKLLPPGAHYKFNMNKAIDDPSSIVYYYIQLGCRTDKPLFAISKLLQFYLCSTTFEGLRTRRSLGYTVLSGLKLFKDSMGLFICVPTNNKECDVMVGQIEDYLKDIEDELEDFDETMWESLKQLFFRSVETLDEDNEFPSSLFSSLDPLICSGEFHTGGYVFKDHWNNLSQILNRTYAFGGSKCEEPIDMHLIRRLSHSTFCKFFKNQVSINSQLKSILILTKPAGEVSYQSRVSRFAQMYSVMLARAGITLTVEELTCCLEKCTDREEFSDAIKHIKGLLSSTRDQIKLHKFSMLNKLGELIGPRTPEIPPPSQVSLIPKQLFNKIEDVRSRCHGARGPREKSKKERIWHLQGVEDVLDCYCAAMSSGKSALTEDPLRDLIV